MKANEAWRISNGINGGNEENIGQYVKAMKIM